MLETTPRPLVHAADPEQGDAARPYLDVCSGGAGFESWPGCQLMTGFTWLFSVPLGHCHDGTPIMTRLLSSKSYQFIYISYKKAT